MSDIIEGVPEGWKLVRIGVPEIGEYYVKWNGMVEKSKKGEGSASNFVIVRKIEPPKPVYKPWTFETCPVGAVVRHKSDNFKAIIVAAGKSRVYLGNLNYYCYDTLLANFELDGTPCGTVEVQE